MTKEEIKDKTNNVFKKVFKDEFIIINDEMTAKEVERWDSLNHLVMISTIEEEFLIKIKLKELIAMKNVGDLLKLIASKVS